MMASQENDRSSLPNVSAGERAALTPNEPTERRRRRRWPIVLLGLVALLLIAVALAPTLLSTQAGAGLVASIINERIKGDVALGGLSLGWTGQCSVRDLEVRDPAGKKVLTVGSARVGKGLIGLATNYERFQTVVIDGVKADVEIDKDGRLTLLDAFEMKTPSQPSEKLPELYGTLTLRNSSLKLMRDGRTVEIPSIESDIDIKTLNAMDLVARVQLPDGKNVDANVTLDNAVHDGKFDPLGGSGTVKLKSDKGVTVAPLTTFVLGEANTQGALTLAVDAKLDKGVLDATWDATVDGLTTTAGGTQVKPVSLRVAGQMQSDGAAYKGSTALSGDVGSGEIDLDYKPTDSERVPGIADLLGAALSGENVAMPGFSLTGKGEIDVAALARVLPGLFNLPAGREIEGGMLKLASLSVTGGARPSAVISASLDTMTAGQGADAITIGPASTDIAVRLEPGTGLTIEQARVQTRSMELVASGTASQLQASIKGDLAAMRDEAGRVVKGLPQGLAGQLDGTFNMSRASDERVDFAADMSITNMSVTADGQRLDVAKAVAKPTGTLMLADGELKTLDLAQTRIDLDEQVVVDVEGNVDVAGGGFQASVAASRAELGWLGARAAAFDVTALQGFSGTMAGRATLSRKNNREPIATDGSLTTIGLSHDGEVVGNGESKLSWNGVSFDPDARDLRVALAKLESSFAQASIEDLKGRLTEIPVIYGMNGAISGDLAAMQQLAGRFVEIDGQINSGQLDGRLQLNKTSGDLVEFAADMNIINMSITADGQRLDVGKADAKSSGTLALANGELSAVDLSHTDVNLDGQVVADMKGKIDVAGGGMQASVNVSRADLGWLGARAAAFDVTTLQGFSGTMAGSATLSRKSSRDPIATDGSLTAAGLSRNGKAIGSGESKLTWNGVSFEPTAGDVRVALAKLESSFARATVENLNGRLANDLALDGRIVADADLKSLLLLTNPNDPPDIAGQFQLSSNLQTRNGVVTIKGDGGVRGFRVGSGANAIHEDANFAIDTTISPDASTLDLRNLTLATTPLNVRLNGMVTDYDGRADLAITGNYAMQWDRLMAVAEEMSPGLSEIVQVRGETSGPISVRGPANAKDRNPTYGGVESEITLSWASARVFDIDIASAQLKPRLSNGVIRVPTTEMSAGGGVLRLGGELDAFSETPTLRVPGQMLFLEQMPITKEMSRSLLSRINPIFGFMTEVNGTASLQVADIALPLGEALKSGGQGRGRLELDGMTMQPSGILGVLLSLSDIGDLKLYAVDISGLDFLIENGRIKYRDFTMTFAKEFDLKFYGSVGFDNTIDLVVSVPVRAPLLHRLGAVGPLGDHLRLLEGIRVDIPMTGTRENPKLDFSAVDVQGLLKGAFEGGLKEGAEDVIGGLLQGLGGGSKKSETEAAPKPQSTPEKKEPKRRRPRRGRPR